MLFVCWLQFAVKMITKKSINNESDRFHIEREIDIQSKLRHPNIISVYKGLWILLYQLLVPCHNSVHCYVLAASMILFLFLIVVLSLVGMWFFAIFQMVWTYLHI